MDVACLKVIHAKAPRVNITPIATALFTKCFDATPSSILILLLNATPKLNAINRRRAVAQHKHMNPLTARSGAVQL